MILTIDGRQATAEPGSTILQAARAVGVEIPRLCFDERLEPISACRLCVVEVDGRPGPVTACDNVATDGMVVRTQSDELSEMRRLNLELLFSDHDSYCSPPCRDACPTHIKIPTFLGHIAAGDYRSAVRALREDMPFPAILGRVCPRPCEDVCRRSLVDEAITICQLHRFAADQCLDDEQDGELLLPAAQKPDTGKRVAVIGGGPAGLAAAFYARLEGHGVKVFEAMSRPGGMLRYGVPSYRLPRTVIDRELNVLWRMGVELQCDARLDVEFTLEQLLDKEGYDAVFLALGADDGDATGISGDDAVGVVSALDLLGRLETRGEAWVGKRVVVTDDAQGAPSGAFTAMDAGRTSLRLGATEVTCLFPQTRTEMQVGHVRLDEALAEGIKLELQVAPVRILSDADHGVTGIEMVRLEFGQPDTSGDRRLVPVEDSRFVIACDQVITARGRRPASGGPGQKPGGTPGGRSSTAANRYTLQTDDARVFATVAGESRAQTVVEAVAQGKKAAWSMHAYLSGEDMAGAAEHLRQLAETPFPRALQAKAGVGPAIRRMAEIAPVFIDITSGVDECVASPTMPTLAPDIRKTNFAEIELGFTAENAVAAAGLCLQCECPANGKCGLQRLGIACEVFENQFHGSQTSGHEAREDTPFIAYDPSRCILCGRCVRVCEEVQQCHVLDFVERGFDALVSTQFGRSMVETACEMCGNCVSACPTGALLDKKSRREALTGSYSAVQTVCPFCGCGCNVELRVKDGRVVQVSSRVGQGPGQGNLCIKGRYGFQFIGHPDRLTQPLMRRAGELVPVSWDEALDEVAQRLLAIKSEHGPDALQGFSSARCTNEENYLFQKLMRAVIGTHNVDHCARLCHASTVTGLVQSLGSGAMTNSFDDLETSKAILIIGSNTSEAHPIAALRLKKAKRNGAVLIVADPRQIDMAKRADYHLQLQPGTNVAVLNGLMNVIVAEGLADEAFIAERTEDYEALKEVLVKYTPELVEQISGVPADDLRQAARAFATAESAAIFYSMGVTQHSHGTEHVLSVSNLALLTGNLGKPGAGVNPLRGQNNVQGACDVGALPDVLPGYQPVSDEKARARFDAAWGVKLGASAGLTVTEAMDAIADGHVRGLFVMGENPMLSDPDIDHVEQALRKLDFLVVQDIFLTETAALADVVLPATSFAEKDGTFTNTERKVQLVRKAVDAPGEARADWEILIALANRLGASWSYLSPGAIMDELATLTPQYAGISFDRLENGGLCWPVPNADHPGTPILHTGSFTRGKGRFFAIDYLPPAEEADAEYPLTLTTGRMLEHYHTGTMTRKSDGINELVPTGFAEVNPADAARLGIVDQAEIRVETRRGTIDVPANVTERVKPGVVFIPFHFWESPANRLTNPARDPQAKIPEFKVCACRVSA